MYLIKMTKVHKGDARGAVAVTEAQSRNIPAARLSVMGARHKQER